MAVLVGDDAKRTMRPDFIPAWLPDLESTFTSIASEKLKKGVLAGHELDVEASSMTWVTLREVLRDLLFALHRDLGFGLEVRSPFARASQVGDSWVGFVDRYSWDKRGTTGEVILETPTPNVVHLLATLVAELCLSGRVPYAHLNVESVDRGQTSDEPPIRLEGAITDIIAAKVLEFLTRTDHIVSLSKERQTGGGG